MAKKKSKKSGGNKKGGGKTRKSGQSAKSKSPAKAEPKDASPKEANDKAEKVAPASEKAAPTKKADTTVPRAIVAGEPDPEPPELVNKLVMVDNAIGYIEQTFLVVALFSLIGVGTYQFVASHVFKINSTWPFAALRNLVFFTAMGGAALAAQKGRMISMDFVARKFSPKNRVILRILIAFFVVFTCYLLFKGGMSVRDSASAHSENLNATSFLGVQFQALLNFVVNPQNALMVLPVGAVLIALHYALHALTDALYLSAGLIPPEEEGPAGH